MELEKTLQAAWDRRRMLFDDVETNAFRLFCGEREGISGLTVDRYAEAVVLQVAEGVCRLSAGEIKSVAEWYLGKTRALGAYLKRFVPDRSQETAGGEMYESEPLAGRALPDEIVAMESGLHFGIRPHEGFSVGLFLDQRENRKFVAHLSRDKRVFNGFAYTCGFSVACASQGASVTSVDLSAKYLNWGKSNFQRNNLPLEGHRFIVDDVLTFLSREKKRNSFYDVVILDPPSFSRSKEHGTFSLRQQLEELFLLAMAVLSPGGLIFFSSNLSEWNAKFLATTFFRLTNEARRKANEISLPLPPSDFAWQTNPLAQALLKLE